MSNGIRTEIKLDGFAKLGTFLDQLPKKAAKKALRRAVSAGITPLYKAAKDEAPSQSGTLKKAQSKKIKIYSNGNVVGLVGANKSTSGEYKGSRRVPAFYMHLVAGGTKPHSVVSGARSRKRVRTALLDAITGGGRHPGAKANDFLGRAWDRTKAETAGLMERELESVVRSEAEKLASGGGR